MKKTLMSLFTIGTIAVVAYAGTTAFFSDEETSTGNTFQAGAIDLLIDSEAHYAGLVCKDTAEGDEVDYRWVLNANTTSREDLLGTPCSLSWASTNLTDQRFFDYDDLKPGDTGENTISLTVDNNPAWVCAEIAVTADSDMDCTEPENAADAENGACVVEPEDGINGEMTDNLSFAWWADDGDNILQLDEVDSLFFQSGVSLQDILTSAGGGNTLYLTLADSLQNFFGTDGQPLTGETKYFVGLAWCMGDMDIDLGTGAITCDGEPVGNDVQTDLMTANISFTAVQERNNPSFRCQDSFRPEVTPTSAPVWTDAGSRTEGTVDFLQEDGRGTVLQLTTINNTDSRVRWTNDSLNYDLDTFTGVSFDSKQVAAVDTVNGNATMRLFIDLDGDLLTTTDVQEITYEPYYNIAAHNPLNEASIQSNAWQTWQTTMANGKFWANGGFLGSTPSGGAYDTNFTLAQVLTAHSSAKVVGISLGMGTYNAGQVVLVDNLIVNGIALSLEN